MLVYWEWQTLTVKNEISTFCICWVIKIVKNAGCQSGDWHSHIPGPEYTGLYNAGSLKIIKMLVYLRMTVKKWNINILHMLGDKNSQKCRMSVRGPAQPHAGLEIHWFSECRIIKNHQNAGRLKTTVKNELSIFCIRRVIKIVKNAGCQSGVRHSHIPGPEYTSLYNAGSLKIIKMLVHLRMTVKKWNINILHMLGDKNSKKCRKAVQRLAQPHTGPGVHRFKKCRIIKNHQNAGRLKTTVKNEISLFCIRRVIKIIKNARCQSGDRHSKIPGLECTGSANARSLKIIKMLVYWEWQLKMKYQHFAYAGW
jgi:hypothetical protein